MSGHTLSAITASPTLGGAVLRAAYGAECSCGLRMYARTESDVLALHARHVEHVKADVITVEGGVIA